MYRKLLIFKLGLVALLLGTTVLSSVQTGSAGPAAQVKTEIIEVISVDSSGTPGDGDSYHATPNYSGSHVAFSSEATNWFPETGSVYCRPETNCIDVFIRDRAAGTTVKLSNGIDGRTGNDNSFLVFVTDDGTVASFSSWASNLVPNDTNRTDLIFSDDGLDAFKTNLVTGQTTRESLSQSGGQLAADSIGRINADGTTYLFTSKDPNVIPGISPPVEGTYLKTVATGEIEYIALGAGGSHLNGQIWETSMDLSQRYLAFTTYATNILPGDNNGTHDVMVHDRLTGITKLASHNGSGGFASGGGAGFASISPDGKFVVFHSEGTDHVPNDNNGLIDVFMYSVETGEITRISQPTTGGDANGPSVDPSTCDGGRYVTFATDATNLMAGDTNGVRDGYLYDTLNNELILLSRTPSGGFSNGQFHKSFLSGNCEYLTMSSDASDLIPNDNNGVRDVFYVKIAQPADFEDSSFGTYPVTALGEQIVFSVNLVNSGDEAGNASVSIIPPVGVTVNTSSGTNGLSYNASTGTFVYNNSIAAGASHLMTFSVTVPASYAGSEIISAQMNLTWANDGSIVRKASAILDGMPVFLPITSQ